jgi:hypothetical protein
VAARQSSPDLSGLASDKFLDIANKNWDSWKNTLKMYRSINFIDNNKMWRSEHLLNKFRSTYRDSFNPLYDPWKLCFSLVPSLSFTTNNVRLRKHFCVNGRVRDGVAILFAQDVFELFQMTPQREIFEHSNGSLQAFEFILSDDEIFTNRLTDRARWRQIFQVNDVDNNELAHVDTFETDWDETAFNPPHSLLFPDANNLDQRNIKLDRNRSAVILIDGYDPSDTQSVIRCVYRITIEESPLSEDFSNEDRNSVGRADEFGHDRDSVDDYYFETNTPDDLSDGSRTRTPDDELSDGSITRTPDDELSHGSRTRTPDDELSYGSTPDDYLESGFTDVDDDEFKVAATTLVPHQEIVLAPTRHEMGALDDMVSTHDELPTWMGTGWRKKRSRDLPFRKQCKRSALCSLTDGHKGFCNKQYKCSRKQCTLRSGHPGRCSHEEHFFDETDWL